MMRSVAGLSLSMPRSSIELAATDERGDAAHMARFFARRGRIERHPAIGELADQRILGKLGNQFLPVDQLGIVAAGMGEDDLLELLIGVGIAQQAGERRDAGAGRDHEQALRRRQSVEHQRARRLLAHQDRIAGLDFLQLGGERAVRHLDREELQLLVPGRACDRIGAEHRLLRIRQADHHELAGAEAQRLRAA